ncbi:MAG: CRISPR-associated endonuclease Cas2 [Bacteroidetes bacterium 4572_77]|nr:MAG: CRISPR-associated endonuclease Cas2 [Bacteroidetes bacterium 4572_77]
MKKEKKELTFFERIKKIRKAGLNENSDLTFVKKDYETMPLDQRLPLVDKILKRMKTKTPDMMYAFILYDIENNKIRTQISKYLIKNNCHRVQKSVFLAELKRKKYFEIHKTLKEINAMYDNHDSIFFIPVGEDILNKMKIVGLNIDFELITDPGNTMFI